MYVFDLAPAGLLGTQGRHSHRLFRPPCKTTERTRQCILSKVTQFGDARRQAGQARASLLLIGLSIGCTLAEPMYSLDWQQHEGFRSAPLPVPATGRTGFTRLAGDLTGIHFTNDLPEEHSLTNHILLNGSGVAAGDIDGDGLCDLYFCSIEGHNRLFRNLGDWKFEDITGPASLVKARPLLAPYSRILTATATWTCWSIRLAAARAAFSTMAEAIFTRQPRRPG